MGPVAHKPKNRLGALACYLVKHLSRCRQAPRVATHASRQTHLQASLHSVIVRPVRNTNFNASVYR